MSQIGVGGRTKVRAALYELEAFLSVHRISLRAYLGIRMLTFTLQNDKAPAQKR